jgi:hypothetical protein
MEGSVDHSEFLEDISRPLTIFYLALAAMNVIAAAYGWRSRRAAVLACRGAFRLTSGALWLALAAVFASMAWAASRGDPAWMQRISLPDAVKQLVNAVTRPTWYTILTFALLAALYAGRRFFVRPLVAWIVLNLAFLFLGLSLTDPDFVRIAAKPDNVPIVGMLFLLGFFTWVATYRAVENDRRIERGEPTVEESESEKVLVWPDLVYIELICMVALTAALIVWAILLRAPLEEPANAMQTPNPSKAPWYFLGLQEMLLYFDPWMAGVVLPALIIFGLCAIPYLDVNKLGNGYYTIRQRRFAYLVHQFGFVGLWITLLVIGTFIRGPNWTNFGLYETWDTHKIVRLGNTDLSKYFWVWMLGLRQPVAPPDAGFATRSACILLRELPGIALLFVCFFAVPAGLARSTRFFRDLYAKMGFVRYAVMMFLLVLMLMLPVKMVAKWVFNLSYFVALPEFQLNL